MGTLWHSSCKHFLRLRAALLLAGLPTVFLGSRDLLAFDLRSSKVVAPGVQSSPECMLKGLRFEEGPVCLRDEAVSSHVCDREVWLATSMLPAVLLPDFWEACGGAVGGGGRGRHRGRSHCRSLCPHRRDVLLLSIVYYYYYWYYY